jgi:hypothetical protein
VTPYNARVRARRGDRARIVLAVVLVLFTALVGILGWAPPAKAQAGPGTTSIPVNLAPPARGCVDARPNDRALDDEPGASTIGSRSLIRAASDRAAPLA